MADDTGAVDPIAHDAPPTSALDPDGSLRDLADDCVHCGFCLPACPTYQLWGEEMDSPRGRIHLITQVLETGAGTAAAAEHLDRCLGCMACVTACPSGVQYNQLIEAARTWAEKGEAPRAASVGGPTAAPFPARSRRDRAVRAAIFATFPYPARLRAALAPLRVAQISGLDKLAARSKLLERLAPEVTAAIAVAPGRSAGRRRRSALPARIPARGERRAVVGMLTGCVQHVLFPQVNAATARVLAAEGCDVIVPPGQGCCGALSLHGGRHAEASAFAKATVKAFEQAGVDAVVVNAAGCGSAMKEYEQVLAGSEWGERAAAFSAKVRDFSEFLAGIGPVASRSELRLTVAYHDACHLGHAQRITTQPRSLLTGIPGLDLTEIPDGATCCGSAGIYNLVQPAAAAELGARKAGNVAATGADLLVSANPGCSLQIAKTLAAAGNAMPVAHIAEVLDASICGRPAREVLAQRL
ncbi:MAG TPA: heterodisulfide reductase-related iron-sulfur binding cluster [Streptosporangiaceae bacterium]|nr:heterodisulfide reductase-related iron-sulfur binding cluster [Streptosporangiaceae bacterium]